MRLTDTNVPQSDRLIDTGGGEEASIRAECHALHFISMSDKWLAMWFSGNRVPKADGVVPAACSQQCAVPIEGHTVDGFGMTGQRFPLGLPSCSIPQLHRSVAAGGGERAPVGS